MAHAANLQGGSKHRGYICLVTSRLISQYHCNVYNTCFSCLSDLMIIPTFTPYDIITAKYKRRGQAPQNFRLEPPAEGVGCAGLRNGSGRGPDHFMWTIASVLRTRCCFRAFVGTCMREVTRRREFRAINQSIAFPVRFDMYSASAFR